MTGNQRAWDRQRPGLGLRELRIRDALLGLFRGLAGHDGVGACPGLLLGGRYELVERLGGGGGGDVWSARDHLLSGKLVAVKILAPALHSDSDPPLRLRREVEALARLDHPSIPLVSDVGRRGSLSYFVMELIHGRGLDEVLAERRREGRPLPTDDALAIFVALCDALAFAHRAGWVHRDLKPGNVALAVRGGFRVYLLDFGLAGTRSGSLTDAGSRLGSLPYMSPEQGVGETAAVSPSSDVFAAAILLLELLTLRRELRQGEPAWVTSLTAASKGRPVDAGALAGTPRWLVPLLGTALHGDPQKRFKDAGVFLRAVESARANAAPAWAPSSSSSTLTGP